MVNNDPVSRIVEQFENLRNSRIDIVDKILSDADDEDKLLADIANMATVLYVLRKTKRQGFRPFRES